MPKLALHSFADLSTAPVQSFIRGQGRLNGTPYSLQFISQATQANQYSNAQIDDYQGLPRRHFIWNPPLQMEVSARFSHGPDLLTGTAGFGFWNDPFLMTGSRWPSLPRAVWFFYSSPPSNMKLDLHTPGLGWKAATIDAWRWPFFALAPLAPLAMPLMRIPALYQRYWPIGQRAIAVCERLLPVDMTAWHTYKLHWKKDVVQFMVDGQEVVRCRPAPRGPLGLVIWFDNQYMVVTPWGQFKYGLIANADQQWMEIRQLRITTS